MSCGNIPCGLGINGICYEARCPSKPRAKVETPARQLLSMLPGYPFFPCQLCIRDGFKGQGGCDHTVLERAKATHPGLVLNYWRPA